MSLSEDELFDQKIRQEFLLEASELLADFESELLLLESGEIGSGAIDRLFRLAHTIKGSAYTVKLKKLGLFVHKIENILSEVREDELDMTSEMVDILLLSVDKVKEILQQTEEFGHDDVDVSDIIRSLSDLSNGDALVSKPAVSPGEAFGFFDDVEEKKPEVVNKVVEAEEVILVCDDEPEIRRILNGLLTTNGRRVIEACDGEDALDKISKNTIDLLITDLRMPGFDGLDLLQLFRKKDERTPCLVISGMADKWDLKTLLNLGVAGFIDKPFETEDVVLRVESCMKLKRLHSNIVRLSGLNYQAYMAMSQYMMKSGDVNSTLKAEIEAYLDEIGAITRKSLII